MKKTFYIQILLYFSSKDLVQLLESINSLDISNVEVFFLLIDQSESEREYRKLQRIVESFTMTGNSKANFILSKQKNYGFGKGHNEIFKKYGGNYEDCFLILNPDTILHYDFISKIKAYLRNLENERWGILELEQFPSEHPKYYDPHTLKTNWASGAGMIISTQAFQEVGMFDENIFMYGEDVDLSIRMRMKGCPILHLPQVKFTHLTKDTDIGVESKFSRVHKLASELYLRYKFGRKKDVDAFLELMDGCEYQEEILLEYEKMKKSLNKRMRFRHFVDKNQDYTNFRWVII